VKTAHSGGPGFLRYPLCGELTVDSQLLRENVGGREHPRTDPNFHLDP
jgi:hypothetical protein